MMYEGHKNFGFRIDLDAFEQVISDEQTLEAFHIRDGKRLIALMAEYEARLNGMRRMEPMPALNTIRAIQWSFYDNGPVPPRSNGSKEPRRQKTHFGGTIKVWTRPGNIDFGKAGQVAWQANTYLWDADDTLFHLNKMRAEKVISQGTVDRMQSLVADATGYAARSGMTCLFSIPLRSIKGSGQKWMDGHLMCAFMDGATPMEWLFFHPEGTGFKTDKFSTKTPAGLEWSYVAETKKAKGESSATTHQTRIAFDTAFAPWATDVQV